MTRRFGSTDDLTLEDALAAPVRSIPRPSLLDAPVGATGKTAKGLAALGIATRGDLVEHLPHSHRDRRDARTVAAVGVGEEATIAVTVRSVSVKPMRNRRQKRPERPSPPRDQDARAAGLDRIARRSHLASRSPGRGVMCPSAEIEARARSQ